MGPGPRAIDGEAEMIWVRRKPCPAPWRFRLQVLRRSFAHGVPDRRGVAIRSRRGQPGEGAVQTRHRH